jgi:hypothetical protein
VKPRWLSDLHWIAALGAGTAAAIISTVAQILLWATLTDALPGVLWRDARLAGAIILGPVALSPPATFDAQIFLVATVVHFGLSIVYAMVLAAIIAARSTRSSLIVGGLFGLALYAINLYGFTAVFPWFTVARGGITLAAHLVFGLSASATYGWLRSRQVAAKA